MSISVLYVEDNEIAVKVVRRVVGHLGGEFFLARNGAEALALLERHFDAVVADLQLPDMSGLAVIRQVRVQQPRVPIIALTGCAMPGEEAACIAAGCTAYVAKPYDPEALEDLLIRCIRSAQT